MVGRVLAELMRGLRRERDRVDHLLLAVPFFETNRAAWIRAGEFALDFELQGNRVPLGDLVIAATVIEHDLELLTRDKHFERVPGLRLYDWRDEDA